MLVDCSATTKRLPNRVANVDAHFIEQLVTEDLASALPESLSQRIAEERAASTSVAPPQPQYPQAPEEHDEAFYKGTPVRSDGAEQKERISYPLSPFFYPGRFFLTTDSRPIEEDETEKEYILKLLFATGDGYPIPPS